MKKLFASILMLSAFLSGNLLGQKYQEAGIPITVSGHSQKFYDNSGSGTLFFGVIVKGNPTTFTLQIQGCMNGVPTCTPLDSYAGTQSTIRGPLTGGWDYIQAIPTWIGGSNVSITINKTGTTGATASLSSSTSGSGTNTTLGTSLSSSSVLSAVQALPNCDGKHIGYVWSPPAGACINISSIGSALVASAPTVNITPGTYNAIQNITLTSSTPGAVVFYTLDGSVPSLLSSVYLSPITVSSSVVVKALTIASGYVNSSVSTFGYTINNVVPAAAPISTVSAGNYTATQTIVLSSATSGATIYYTLDGTIPTTSSSVYSGPITISSSKTINAVAKSSSTLLSSVSSFAYVINTPVALSNVTLGTNGAMNGTKLFPGSPTLYTNITNAPVSANNTTYQCYAGISSVSGCQSYNFNFKMDWSGNEYETTPYGIPYNVYKNCPYITLSASNVDAGSTNISESDDIPFPDFGCAGAVEENGTDPRVNWAGASGDHHWLGLDVELGIEVDSYQLYTPSTGQLTDDSTAIWDVTIPFEGQRALARTSADAAGFPILPFLVRPDELLGTGTYAAPNGTGITHTMRITLDKFGALYSSQGCLDGPATHQVYGYGGGANKFACLGQRIRLKPSFTLSYTDPVCSMIVTGLKTYGAIFADVGDRDFISGVGDVRYNDDALLKCGQQFSTADFDWIDTTNGAPLFTTYLNDGTSTSQSVKCTAQGTCPSLTLVPPSNVVLTASKTNPALGSTITLTGTATNAGPGLMWTDCAGVLKNGVVSFTPTQNSTCSLYVQNASGISRSSAISITPVGPQVANPVFSPAAGSYNTQQNVAITSVTNGATIYYTTDGSTPTTSSPVYTSPIAVSSIMSLSALATKSGSLNSSIVQGNYNVIISGNAPQLVAGANHDSSGSVTSTPVTVTNSQSGSLDIVLVSMSATTALPTSVVDSNGDTGTLIGSVYNNASGISTGDQVTLAAYEFANMPAGSVSFTVNFASGYTNYSVVSVLSYVGAATTNPVEGFTATSTAPGTCNLSLTTTGTNEAVVEFVNFPYASASDPNAQLISQVSNGVSGSPGYALGRTVAAAGTIPIAITASNGNYNECLAFAIKHN